MYYVLWVNTGNEEKALQAIHTLVPKNLYKECFYPMRRLRKKIRGKWTEYNDRLLPGYLFITSEDAEGLYLALHKIPMFVSVLGKTGIEENIEFIPLPPEEEEWLRDLMGMKKDPGENTEERKDHIVGLSQIGFNEKDEIEILSGPLKNMSGRIRRIHLHKRVAEVEVRFMNTKVVLHMGVELIGKMGHGDGSH